MHRHNLLTLLVLALVSCFVLANPIQGDIQALEGPSPGAVSSTTPTTNTKGLQGTTPPANNRNGQNQKKPKPAGQSKSQVSGGKPKGQTEGLAVNAKAANPTINNTTPSTGQNLPLVAAVAGVGVFAIVGIAAFTVVRARRRQVMTQILVAKSASFSNLDESLGLDAAEIGASSVEEKSLGTYAVVSTYTPALPDELDVRIGDKVTVLVEFDDGWVQGVNESRGKARGVFPKVCIDYDRPVTPGSGFVAQIEKKSVVMPGERRQSIFPTR